MTGKEQKGLTCILRTGTNYKSKQQRGPITSQSGRGRGDMNQNTKQHTRSTTIQISEPTPSPSEQKDQIHHYILRFYPKVMGKKQISVPKLSKIHASRSTRRQETRQHFLRRQTFNYHHPQLKTILQIFLHQKQSYTISFTCTKLMTKTQRLICHSQCQEQQKQLCMIQWGTRSGKTFLWLTSEKLSAKQKDRGGFVKNDNPTYTHPQGLAGMIKG